MRELFELIHYQPFLVYSFIFAILSYATAIYFRKQKVVSSVLIAFSIASFFIGQPHFESIFLIVWAILLFLATLSSSYDNKLVLSFLGILGVILLGWMGIIHMIPFFTNWKMFSGLYFGSSTMPYNLYYNLDKGIIGVVLFVYLVRTPNLLKDWKLKLNISLCIGSIAAASLILLTFLLGYIKWDPKIPNITPFWLVCNVFFVCFAEEVFFRGFIFGYVSKKAFYYLEEKERFIIGYVLSSVLFGLYHYRLGWMYMILAFIAGLFYGWAYHKTKRVEFSTVSHLMVNAIHFFLFSYPMHLWE